MKVFKGKVEAKGFPAKRHYRDGRGFGGLRVTDSLYGGT